MKKKIAVFGAGWGSEIMNQFMSGVANGIKDLNADVYLFLCFPLLTDALTSARGELNIFKLPVLKDFDGAIIFGNSIDHDDAFESLVKSCKDAHIPTVSCGRKPDYGYFLTPDNYNGMKQLCENLKNVHGIRKVFYLAGSANHPDSLSRAKAISDTFEEFDSDDIFYTNWDLTTSSRFIDEYIKSGRELPDAFMCANDGLAIFAASELQKNGYRIPDDVYVTGFDDTYSSALFNPTLTTVSQNFETIGCESVRIIIDSINGKTVPSVRIIPCVLKNRESTESITDSEIANSARRDIGHKLFVDRLIANNFATKLNFLDAALLSGLEFIDIYSSLSSFFGVNSGFEKGNMHILLEPDYENSVYDESITLRQEGYSDYMFDIFSMNDGRISFNPNFETRQLVPNIDDNSDENHTYIFMPLHDNERTMGYFVFRDIVDEIDKNNNLVRYEQRLNSIFIKYRKNLLANYLNNKLKIINETDPLTGVKNRTAYDSVASRINSQIFNRSCEDFAVVIFDINSLKAVNDEFGHEYGDSYIINSCKLLCDIFKHSPVFRIGGDEFLTILKGEDYDDRNSLLIELNNRMDDLAIQDIERWKKVSIAFGMALYQKNKDENLSDVFKRADTVMYENKKEFKGKADIR